MVRFHILKDGKVVADTFKRDTAIEMIRDYQKKETHPFLRANFSVIEGEEEFIPYEESTIKKEKKEIKKQIVSVQELTTFMRDLAYGDSQKHKIDWILRIIHPSTNEGAVGYSGGLWKRDRDENWVSVSFSYDEIKGIHNFKSWKEIGEIRHGFDGSPSFSDFKDVCVKMFEVKKIFKS